MLTIDNYELLLNNISFEYEFAIYNNRYPEENKWPIRLSINWPGWKI